MKSRIQIGNNIKLIIGISLLPHLCLVLGDFLFLLVILFFFFLVFDLFWWFMVFLHSLFVFLSSVSCSDGSVSSSLGFVVGLFVSFLVLFCFIDFFPSFLLNSIVSALSVTFSCLSCSSVISIVPLIVAYLPCSLSSII
uniref:Uncharacterized protein n=1 Tax=Cacopsylla melanoneura TaxID=428564 RepID=A0A8D8SH00_9HEMI